MPFRKGALLEPCLSGKVPFRKHAPQEIYIVRCWLFLIIGLLLAPAVSALDHYEVRVDKDLSAVEVTACFAGQPPRRLYRDRKAAEFTEWLRLDGKDIQDTNRRIALGKLPNNACAAWRVNLDKATAAGDNRSVLRIGEAVLSDGDIWFWRDNEKRAIEVRVHLPADMQLSAPWPELASSDGTKRYQPTATPASWFSRLVLGKFTTQKILLGDASIKMTLLGDFDDNNRTGLQQWISQPAMGVANVIGHFPQAQTQILVVGIGSRSSAVPFAHVLRGGGMAIELFVDETRSADEFQNDWTATHELSHILLPYVASQDRWLSEGLASYYQNVLRARDGRLSELQAWQKLNSGFQRGKDDVRRGGTMDTYWRGAAILLQADSKLRALSDGRQSLDSALAGLHECCYDPGRRWLAWELLEQLDQLTGYDVFTELYAKHAWDRAFPDPQLTLQKLGVDSGSSGTTLNDDAPWSRIRQGIMSAARGTEARPSASESTGK